MFSTRPDLEDLSNDFRSYTLLGDAGEYQLNENWRIHAASGGYTNGKTIVDNPDDFDGFTAEEGVKKVIDYTRSKKHAKTLS